MSDDVRPEGHSEGSQQRQPEASEQGPSTKMVSNGKELQGRYATRYARLRSVLQRRSGRPFKHKSKKGRQSVEVAGIAVAIAAAVISSISAFYAYRAYQSQQDASKRAMADQVVIVAPPLSSDRVDQLRKQHPVNYIDYFPMYVRNYGRLPVLGLIAEADINGKKMQSRTIGTLLPCTEVEVGDVLRAALSETGSRNNWSVVITFQDVAGQSWKRSLSGAPAPIKDNRFVLREGTGIATGHVDGCQAG